MLADGLYDAYNAGECNCCCFMQPSTQLWSSPTASDSVIKDIAGCQVPVEQ